MPAWRRARLSRPATCTSSPTAPRCACRTGPERRWRQRPARGRRSRDMHKLAELCVRRPVFATMLVLSLTVVGAYAFFGLGVDLLPNIDIPTVTVSVSDPGSEPEQVETEITKKLEGAL